MWVLGTLVYYLFHRVVLWYMGLFSINSMKRPVASIYRWFHYSVIAFAAVMFVASGFFYYLTNPWLTFLPVPLFALSLMVFANRQRRRFNGIISRAVEIQVKLEREGSPQGEINKAIYLGATGKVWSGEAPDGDLKSFLYYFVFTDLMAPDVSEDFQRSLDNPKRTSTSDKMGTMVDFYYKAMSQF